MDRIMASEAVDMSSNLIENTDYRTVLIILRRFFVLGLFGYYCIIQSFTSHAYQVTHFCITYLFRH